MKKRKTRRKIVRAARKQRRTPSRTSEADMAEVVQRILNAQPKESMQYAELFDIVPRRLHLTRADTQQSRSRPGEQVWQQILRNIGSHERNGFVRIKGGLRLQWQRGRQSTPEAHEARHAA